MGLQIVDSAISRYRRVTDKERQEWNRRRNQFQKKDGLWPQW